MSAKKIKFLAKSTAWIPKNSSRWGGDLGRNARTPPKTSHFGWLNWGLGYSQSLYNLNSGFGRVGKPWNAKVPYVGCKKLGSTPNPEISEKKCEVFVAQELLFCTLITFAVHPPSFKTTPLNSPLWRWIIFKWGSWWMIGNQILSRRLEFCM